MNARQLSAARKRLDALEATRAQLGEMLRASSDP